jgi:hypothetical protein
MAYFFAFLLMVSFTMLIIGLFSPKTALFWKKTAGTRKQAALIYAGMSLILFIAIGFTAPKLPAEAGGGESTGTGEKPAAAAPAPLTEEEMEYRLAESCDTDWRWNDQPEKYVKRTGYIVDTYVNSGDWEKTPWTTTTFRQTGPETFEEDRKRKIALGQQVQVLKTAHGEFLTYTDDFLTVSPVGSTETYIILERNFSLRNPDACSLIQRAKNKFPTRAEYEPPTDANKRPLDDRDMTWIDAPAGSRIVVREYNKERQMYDGTLYDKKGELMVPDAHFWPETVREVK